MLTTIQPSFSSGEVSPSLYGRVDLPKWHAGMSVARNMVVSYKGGAFSRAGTQYVGKSLQGASSTSFPPRLIEFTYNIFQSYQLEFGQGYMRVIANGAYVTENPIGISAITTTNPVVVHAVQSYSNGDLVFIQGSVSQPQVDGRLFLITSVSGTQFSLQDEFGVPVDGTTWSAYAGGGTVARVFTLATPYNVQDLPYLKFSQSADTMSLCCVNQQTGQDYQPQELVRVAANNWTITPFTTSSNIAAPTAISAAPTVTWTAGHSGPAAFGYLVTAVDINGNESTPTTMILAALNSVDIAIEFGSIFLTWSSVVGAISYNVYKCAPDYTNTGFFAGQQFGFVGTVAGATSWQDTNIVPDYTTTPPAHLNPFNGSGNYPGVVNYFQQRRVYAGSLNAPDEYDMSQPGNFNNFDQADPPIDSDAIQGSPWATQVNGIQWLMPMPGGLIIGTGKDAWQLSGTSGVGSPVTPAQQNAQPQESVGFSGTVAPFKVDYDLLYLQSLGSIVRALRYNFYFNIYAGVDLTVLSSHLFAPYVITQWAWAKEPWKVAWACRNDGKALSLTYIADQQISAWTRHDTNGQFVGVSSSIEPPINAIYWIVKRFIPGKNTFAYFIERMNGRLWANIEQCWCVDAGLALVQPTPNATLQASQANPPGNLYPPVIVSGGSNYTSPVGVIVDAAGPGTGATISFTVVSGVITGALVTGGTGYVEPLVEITDATGSGAVVQVPVDNRITFNASSGVFSSGMASGGYVIRAGGGIAVITNFISSTQVRAALNVPISYVFQNDPFNKPIPVDPGDWTLTQPVTQVSGLNHLEGMEVAILADGSVVPNQTVVNGQITLSVAASQITVGLPFTAQLQSMHATLSAQGEAQLQGKRKRIGGVTVRVANSRGLKVGQDQPIAAVQPNQAEIPWGQQPNYLTTVPDPGNQVTAGVAIPLFSGDLFVRTAGDWSTTDNQPSMGMVAIQQDNPLPMEILAVMPDLEIADVEQA